MLFLLGFAAASSTAHLVERHGVEYLEVGRSLYATRASLEASNDTVNHREVPMVFDGGRIVNHEPGPREGRNSMGVATCGIDWVKGDRTLGTIDLQPIISEWLKDDGKWGGHQQANRIRYMGTYGGLFGQVHQVVQEAERTALAVLSVHEESPSGQPIGGQFLVRLFPKPFRMELVRPVLHFPNDGAYMSSLVFLRYGRHLLSIEGGAVKDLAGNGSVVAKWLDLPPAADVRGIAGNRWLIARIDSDKGTKFTATDLKRRKSFTILNYIYDPKSPLQLPALYGGPVPSSPFLVFGQDRNDSQAVKWFTVHLPDGRRARLDGPAYEVAGPYAYDRRDEEIDLYSATTGKLIGRNLK